MNDAERALACMRRLYERRAGRVEPLPFGVAVVTPELRLIRALFLPTAESDRAQHLYRRLGFEAVAVEAIFGRPG